MIAREGRQGCWWRLGGACYLILLLVIASSLFSARRWALAELATREALGDWETWRQDVREQAQAAPVHRRVPSSTEPPMLVLLRDHFAVMMSGAILFSSVLFWITAWLMAGMLTTPAIAADPTRNAGPR